MLCSQTEYINNSSMDLVPWSLIDSVQNKIRSIFPEKKIDLFLCAQWENNFSIALKNMREFYEDEFQDILEVLDPKFIKKALDAFDDKPFDNKELYLLQVPVTERMNPLRLSLIGHEIGHIVAEKILTEDFKRPFLDNLADILLEYDEDGQFYSDNYNIVIYLWERALEEYLADYFSVKIWGIASAFSIYSFAIENNFNEPVEPIKENIYHGYPSWSRRLKVVKTALERMDLLNIEVDRFYNKRFPKEKLMDIEPILIKWFESLDRKSGEKKKMLNNYLKEISSMTEDIEFSHHGSIDPEVQIAYSQIKKAFFEAIDIIDEKYQEHFYDSETLYKQVPWLLMLLESGITPNEYYVNDNLMNPDDKIEREPASLASILNAMCIWYIMSDGFTKCSTSEKNEEKLITSMQLTLRAIETSHLQKKYSILSK